MMPHTSCASLKDRKGKIMSDHPELFDIPPVKSPRLLWMEKHGITVERKATSNGPRFIASGGGASAAGDDENEALQRLAMVNGIKLWNQ